MKILYYNWVQFDDLEGRGGGVTVYQRNLIEGMLKKGFDIYFLSSGLSYTILKKETYIRPTSNIFGDRCKSFEIVNSAVPAPGHASFFMDDIVRSDRSMLQAIERFVLENGPFDVVHFNNLEGLPLAAIDKSLFGGAQLFFSAHNYFSVCPQVNLWREESANCIDYRHGHNCTQCLMYTPSLKQVLAAHQLSSMIKSTHKNLDREEFLQVFSRYKYILMLMRLLNTAVYILRRGVLKNPLYSYIEKRMYKKRAKNQKFARLVGFDVRRGSYIRQIEENCSLVLAVSRRTKDVLVRAGFDERKIEVVYIGSKYADNAAKYTKRHTLKESGHLAIGYFGYMRRDKGFYFFLESMEALDERLAKKITIVVAAQDAKDGSRERLRALMQKFRDVVYFNGYSAEDMDDIVRYIDIGVIPSLWEDNLPQVAIELVCKGIPILSSDLGGASELFESRDFTFAAGDMNALHEKLEKLLNGDFYLSDFWLTPPRITTIERHCLEMSKLYTLQRDRFQEISKP